MSSLRCFISIFSNYHINFSAKKMLSTFPPNQVLSDILNYVADKQSHFSSNKTDSIPKFISPDELMSVFEQELKVSDHGIDDNELVRRCKKVVDYSVTSNHPRFYNQLFGSVLPSALIGAVLTDCINTSSYTYEVAPVFILMEKALLRYHLEMVGFADEDADGCFSPGGSIANMYAINLARHRACPEQKSFGMTQSPILRIYCSKESHYSISKGATFMGIGTSNVVPVNCDFAGRMKSSILRQKIQLDREAGLVPLMVVATSGTTVCGAYDPLNDIADVCDEEDLWMHVDGCLGASALVSDKLKHLMMGCHRADSLTWNPHKMMGLPLQCSMLLTKHGKLLHHSHTTGANYLFQSDKCYPLEFDTGDKVIQCGRRVDVLKLWTAWQSMGRNGYSKYIEKKFQLANTLADKIRSRPGQFQLLCEPESTNVLFRYIPPALRGQVSSEEWMNKLDKSCPIIKEAMMKKGTMLIGYQKVDGVNCWRMVTSQISNTDSDLDFILDEFDRLSFGKVF